MNNGKLGVQGSVVFQMGLGCVGFKIRLWGAVSF